MNPLAMPMVYYLRVLPEIVLTVTGMLVMVVEAPSGRGRARISGWLALLGSLVALAAVGCQAAHPGDAFNHAFRVDSFTVFLHLVLIGATALVILLSLDFLPAQGLEHGEFYALVLFGTVGMGFMAGSVDLIMIFIGLEISSIATYVLAGFRRNDAHSTEASLKYFLLGSFATAFFLFGIAFLYGATGSTNVYDIAAGGLMVSPDGLNHGMLVLAAAGLMFIGLGFKVSAAPFQVWTPDVYEGAPALVTGFMSAGPKAAAFAVLLRVFLVALQGSAATWFWLIWAAAILSMCLGNLGALWQTNLKRLLAYSSIAQAGYILVALASLGPNAAAAVLFYLAAYVAMNIGAFAIVSHLAQRNERYVELKDYAGIGFRYPWLGASLAIFLCSLIGVPLTAGFFGKLYIFQAALGGHLVGLTVIALLNSALAAYYYLRIIVYMYMRQPDRDIPAVPTPATFGLAVATCLTIVIWLGVMPDRALDLALQGAKQLLP